MPSRPSPESWTVNSRPPPTPKHSRQDRVQLVELGPGERCLAGLGEGEADHAVLHAEAAIADALAPERQAHLGDEVLEALLDHGVDADLEQQVRAALQIEAEIDLAFRQPVGPSLDRVPGKEVGHGGDHGTDQHDDDEPDLPGLERLHQRSLCCGGRGSSSLTS
jgi:hypothetical protein